MHDNELATDETLVTQLLAAQFPQWAGLPVRRFASGGTSNAIYRLGDELAARLPLTSGKTEQMDKEHRFLPVFAARLPLAIPEPVARGAAVDEYPSEWSVYRWLPGDVAADDRLADAVRDARALAEFVLTLQGISTADGPPPGNHNFWRGVPLAARDARTREAIAASTELVDAAAVTEAWERDLKASLWDAPAVWVHGDLLPGNLLVADGRLSAVIDWGGLGVGDPAIELLPAWALFRGASRSVYRRALGVDDATWARGRGLALSVGLIGLPYYLHTNATMTALARRLIGEALADHDLGA